MYNSTNTPRPAYNNVQVPMDLSRTQAPYNRRQYQANTAQYNMAVAQTQERPHHPKGPCFNCGKPGHFARDCRTLSGSSINYMDTTEDDMQNIPQPMIMPQVNVANLKA
jgi:hypothetical protein